MVLSAREAAQLFQREVAAIYRALGAHVEEEVVLEGNQIDILVEEVTTSGSTLRTAMECNAYTRPVDVSVVNQVASLFGLLKQRSIVDRGALVTSQGFTLSALTTGKEMGLELLEIADLEQRVKGKEGAVKAAEVEIDRACLEKAPALATQRLACSL